MSEAAGPAPVESEGARGRAENVYGEAMNTARRIFRAAEPETVPQEEARGPAPAALTLPHSTVTAILDVLKAGDQEILALADRSASDHFIFGHSVNVTIYALHLGKVLGLPGEDLSVLGIAGMLHDLGLAAHMELVEKPSKLTDAEVRLLKDHLQTTDKLLNLFSDWTSDLKTLVRRVISETHARRPASGASESVHPFAAILSLCEVYEAFTHIRPWRPRTVPHEVLRAMVEENPGDFDPGLVRAFVEALSFYPPGSFVKLSTGEIAKVLSTTPGLPLRPRVWVMIDPAGGRSVGARVLNLAVKPSVYILDAVDETKIKTADAKLALALKAQRWWLRGI